MALPVRLDFPCDASSADLNDFLDRLHAEDLAHLLGMQQKELRKLCARLREDRLIAVYVS